MRLAKISTFKNEMRKNGVIICFSGILSQGIIQEIGEALRSELQTENAKTSKYFSILSIFVEQTQNILNYYKKKSETRQLEIDFINSGIVCIGSNGDKYFVCSSNLIEVTDAEKLNKRLEFTKNNSIEEIKKLYKEQIRKDITDESYGAGLGFYEMAKKSTEPVEYFIGKSYDKYYEFTINAVI